MLYGPTNEELITDIFRSAVTSYRELPLTLYHIQWKFRDEVRPRFGVMRGREFLMKDGYNFDLTEEDALHAYNRHMVSYIRTYERMGLKAIPMRAAAGAIGGDHTHEFLVLAPTGESAVFYDRAVTDLTLGDRAIDYADRGQVSEIVATWTAPYARTDERHDPAAFAEVPEERRVEGRGIEVGQIFYFGTKYSEPMKALVVNEAGERVPVHMGSHGIGVSRLVGAIIEASHDEQGIVWPEGVTPFGVGIVNLKQGDARGRRRLRGALCRADGGRARSALRRPRRAGGGEVRDDGPDRAALADHRRAARAGGRQGRADRRRRARARRCRPRRRWRAARRSTRGADGGVARGRPRAASSPPLDPVAARAARRRDRWTRACRPEAVSTFRRALKEPETLRGWIIRPALRRLRVADRLALPARAAAGGRDLGDRLVRAGRA